MLQNNVIDEKSLPIDKLVLTSGLPLSVTVVGIGGANFSKVSCLFFTGYNIPLSHVGNTDG